MTPRRAAIIEQVADLIASGYPAATAELAAEIELVPPVSFYEVAYACAASNRDDRMLYPPRIYVSGRLPAHNGRPCRVVWSDVSSW